MITIYNLLGGFGGGNSNEIVNVNFDFKVIQRTDTPWDLNATIVGANFINKSWAVYEKTTGDLVALSLSDNDEILIDEPGYYNIKFVANTATDRYERTFYDIFNWYPQFTEGEADIVVNLASGNYFQDFNEADNSGLKIYVKGSGNYQFSPVGLTGTSGWANKVRIQKSNDNTHVVQNAGSSPYLFFLDGSGGLEEHIVIDGFNADGTPGWDLIGGASQAQLWYAPGAHTDIMVMGFNCSRTSHVAAASISAVPITNATYNSVTYGANHMDVFGCTVSDAGDEGIYWGYNNDATQGGYRPTKYRDCVIAWNTITNAGRDGIQPGGAVRVSVHDNIINGWGLNHETSHESALSWNSGNTGKFFNNYMVNGEMLLNIQSGYEPWDDFGGAESTPQLSEFYNNFGDLGTYTSGGSNETFAIYIQTQNGGANTANWPLKIYNNTFKANKKMAEAFFHTGSFTISAFTMVNNVIIETGDSGTYDEVNFTGNGGTLPSSPIIQNLVRQNGSESDLLLNSELKPVNLLSPVYTGAYDVSSFLTNETDIDGFPMYDGSSFTYGAYSGYNYKVITPIGSAATFSTPLAVGTLTSTGGTITFEANQQGLLYWVVVANGATAPTNAQIRAGTGFLDSGTIEDFGTAGSYVITSGVTGTSYDLYGLFVTIDNVEQASATKVDYTTTSDVVSPTISTFVINDANRDRIYFSSSEIITATTYGGFTVATPTKTINAITINSGQTTGHYFTVSAAFVYGETPTLAYSGSGSNLQDPSANALASFGATAITNNIEAGALEAFVWVDDTGSPTISGGDLTTTTTATTARSSQIIPSASGGRIVCSWDVLMQASAGGWKFGLIGSSDARTAANIKMTCNYLANTNTDIYEGTTYKSTVSGASGIQASGVYHSWRIDRGDNKIYFETSTDLTNWTLRATYSSTTTGDLRGGFVSTQTGKKVPSAQIQADQGLT